MDGDLYDEFGNYLGSDSEQEEVFEVANAAEAAAPQPETVSGVLDDAGMLPGRATPCAISSSMRTKHTTRTPVRRLGMVWVRFSVSSIS